MTLNLKWIKKRERNNSINYIVLRKNYRILETLAIIHYNFGGLQKPSYKLVIVNFARIYYLIETIKLQLPFWFQKFCKPFKHPTFYHKYFFGNPALMKYLTTYSHEHDLSLMRKYKHFYYPFYSPFFILRLWLNVYYARNKLINNVQRVKKAI